MMFEFMKELRGSQFVSQSLVSQRGSKHSQYTKAKHKRLSSKERRRREKQSREARRKGGRK